MKSLKNNCVFIVIMLFVAACGSEQPTKDKTINQPTTSLQEDENELQDRLPNEEGKIYQIVEEMPCFSGCGELATLRERKKCSDTEILKFIFENLKYPKAAKEKGIHTKIVVRFVVDEEGKIQAVKALRNHANSLGKEVERVIRLMPDWKPGKHKEKPVKVEITIPVNIKPE